jgi:hypothetical protein
MIPFFIWVNWRALTNLPAINLIYPFSFLFGVWLLLKVIEWASNRKAKNK